MSSQGVARDPSKIEVVTPPSFSELRSFLAFEGYYHGFIGFSKLAAPLQRLVAEWGGRDLKIEQSRIFKMFGCPRAKRVSML